MRDPELTAILVQELERHLVALEAMTSAPVTELEAARRTVHALKGSAGLAGEPELAAAMQRLERRLRDGDASALPEVAATVRLAVHRIGAGEPAAAGAWPEPPPDLGVSELDPLVRAQYMVEVSDRLARIDDALTAVDADEAAAELFRHVHTMKGAASAASDEPMTWFCHGLEERIRTRSNGAQAVEEVASWRAVLGALIDDPEAALATLRGVPVRSRRATQRPPGLEPEIDATIRVSAQSVDALLDYSAGIAAARERVAARGHGAMEHSRTMRRLRADLVEALRLIGPPRPWGAPAAALRRVEGAAAALGKLSEEVEGVSALLHSLGQSLRDDVGASRKILSAMRQTPIRGLFHRLASAVAAESKRTGRSINVQTVGGDELVDRRLVEALAEPCLQLARNAIAHGIEAPDARVAMAKPRAATLTLSAGRIGNRLYIAIADDGAGVDLAAVRARAVDSGLVTDVLARASDDQTLLELLFLPGFSTRSQSPDLLAGRGIGLDITLASVQRLGGSIHLSSRQGLGFEARVDVPVESGLVNVLWIVTGETELALPVSNARRIRPYDEVGIPPLAACLEPTSATRSSLALDLDDGENVVAVGVDSVGVTEEVLVRPLSPLLAGLGPYAGAVVRGDGSIRLVVDAHALAPRARALGRVGPPSDSVCAIPEAQIPEMRR